MSGGTGQGGLPVVKPNRQSARTWWPHPSAVVSAPLPLSVIPPGDGWERVGRTSVYIIPFSPFMNLWMGCVAGGTKGRPP